MEAKISGYHYEKSIGFSVECLLSSVRHLKVWQGDDFAEPYWRWYWVSRGGLEMSHGGQRFRLEPHQCALIPPDTHFSGRLGGELDKVHAHFRLSPCDLKLEPGIYVSELTEYQGVMLRRLVEQGVASAGHQNDEQKTERLGMALVTLLTESLWRLDSHLWKQQVMSPEVKALAEKIHQSLRQPMSNGEMSAWLGIHEKKLKRDFVRDLGVTPQAYQMQVRIREAQTLLLNSSMSIDGIAQACGFLERNHFTKMFKQHLGVAPARYRRHRGEAWM